MSSIDHALRASRPHVQPQRVMKRIFGQASARRDLRLDRYAPKSAEAPSEMRSRIASAVREGCAQVSFSRERQIASAIWMEPSRDWEGPGATGIVVLREDVRLKAGASSGIYPIAAISSHAMIRMIERSGVTDLDGLQAACQAPLGWSHIALKAGFDGEYLVPHADGLFCCRATHEGILDEGESAGGALRPITVIKTWIDTGELRAALAREHASLLHAVRGRAPVFPGFQDCDDGLLDQMDLLRLAGRRREAVREKGWSGEYDRRFVAA